jgi:hypothetical protein
MGDDYPGDSVQWFRAESEFERSLERLEKTHAEFERLIRRFAFDRDAWQRLATEFSSTPGHVAYAREHSDMCETLRADADMKYEHGAIPFLRRRPAEVTLSDRVQVWRSEEDKLFAFDRYFKFFCVIGSSNTHAAV